MRILFAGASGVIGSRLVPGLVAGGHTVLGLSRTQTGMRRLTGLGAQTETCDVFDADRLLDIARRFSPEVVIHQLTDLADDPDQIDAAANARMRIEGTDNLIAAADAANAHHLLAQSVCWDLGGVGAAAVDHLEAAVLDWGGVVLRYGQLYGPGTYHPTTAPPTPRVDVDRAAALSLTQLTAPSGIVEITDEGAHRSE